MKAKRTPERGRAAREDADEDEVDYAPPRERGRGRDIAVGRYASCSFCS